MSSISQSDDNRHSHHHLRAVSPVPLQATIGVNTTKKKRVQGRSEDWGALVDSPESPVLSHATANFHPYQQQYLPQQPFLGLVGYSDSPAEETMPSRDYMQHPYASVPGSEARPHAQTDPTSRGHPYRHQQHSSTSSVPMAYTGNMGPNDHRGMTMPNISGARPQRKSWTPSTFEALGGKTPPLNSGSHSKRSSVAMSVSLLNDASVVAKYREMAVKTNDASVQLSYAKYLLEIGGPLDPDTPLPSISTPPAATPANGSPKSRAPSPIPPMPKVSTDGLSEEAGKRQLTQEGMYWIEKLAKEGQPEAQFIRGTWHEHGLYQAKKSTDKAHRYYQSASKGDYGPAHYKVGYFCEQRKDNNKAIVLYKKAAIHNDVAANHRLAIVYLHGELGQNKNLKAGLQYLKRAAALADENAPKAPYVLGQILSREYKAASIPDDVAFPDDGEAFEYFRKSAQLGYGPANLKVGSCYEYGTLGCAIDPIMSVQHYERAIMAGDSNGEAEMALSGWYLSGADNLIEADDKLAFEYASKAAEKGLAKAQYAMGYYYEVGISVPLDILKAMEFYKLAAAAGNKDAQARLSKDTAFDRLEHQRSIKRIKQGRKTKDQNCPIM
ncbi:hypothetical protein CPB97_006699 [Podila verticillata]|nr:hypothetical protein CPB97_006699 [Podila verticillata]